MDNIQSVQKGLHLYLVILFLLFVSRILAFKFMLMSVKIRRYRAIIIIIIIIIIIDKGLHRQTPAISKLLQVSKADLAINNDSLKYVNFSNCLH